MIQIDDVLARLEAALDAPSATARREHLKGASAALAARLKAPGPSWGTEIAVTPATGPPA